MLSCERPGRTGETIAPIASYDEVPCRACSISRIRIVVFNTADDLAIHESSRHQYFSKVNVSRPARTIELESAPLEHLHHAVPIGKRVGPVRTRRRRADHGGASAEKNVCAVRIEGRGFASRSNLPDSTYCCRYILPRKPGASGSRFSGSRVVRVK